MLRWTLILTLLAGPLPIQAGPPLAARADQETPAEACCCCAEQVCQCGCAAPTSEAPGQPRPAPRFCGCDDDPLTLPTASVPLPQLHPRSVPRDVDALLTPEPAPRRPHLAQLPHGPPGPLADLATIILLN